MSSLRVPVYHGAHPGERLHGAKRRQRELLVRRGDIPACKHFQQGTPSRFRVLLLTCALVVTAQLLQAQTLEDRVASLEVQVAELWELYERAHAPGTTVPAELVGNEHLRWGYPGGECAVLVNDYFVTCHDNAYRVPEWVTYHLTAEFVSGYAERTDDFRPDPRLPKGRRAELADYEGSGYDRGT